MPLPFYLPSGNRLRIVIAGGGYAGLSALSTLREYCPDADILLIDPRSHHLKITHLHESFRRPLADFAVPFRAIEKRFNLRHIQAALDFDDSRLQQWNTDRALSVGDETISFDYLLIATGAGFHEAAKAEEILALDDFTLRSGPDLLESALDGAEERAITVVGGGATGIQFLFELAHYLRQRRLPCRLRLVDAEAAPLGQFHPDLGRYVSSRMDDFGIEFLPRHFFRGQENGLALVENRDNHQRNELPSARTLLFLGKASTLGTQANAFGQVVANGITLSHVFTAGDCSQYRAPGSNVMSAQTAVRKGKLAARNLLRHSGRLKLLEPWLHRDMGYVINLGPYDAVGWFGLERNVVGGLPAAVVKEVVEAQYDLLLAGIDTYII